MSPDEARLFDGARPDVPATYAALLTAAESLGRFTIETKKTCIHLVSGSAFAGVHPQKGKMWITVKSEERLDSPRIRKAEQASARRFYCDVDLFGPADVDAELIGWLKASYDLSARRS